MRKYLSSENKKQGSCSGDVGENFEELKEGSKRRITASPCVWFRQESCISEETSHIMSIEPGVNTVSFSVSIGRTIALES
jgi:hypothetical protein